MHLRLKNIVIVHFTMRHVNQTMVGKIPWETCLIALIFSVFKTVLKSTVIRFKVRCFPLIPQYNVETGEIACTRVQHCRSGGGAVQV